MKKKVLAIALVTAMSLALTGCGEKEVEQVQNEIQDAADEAWIAYMTDAGLPREFAEEMVSRRDRDYFPLTDAAYLELLKVCGFTRAEVFWRTCSDIGIIAFK